MATTVPARLKTSSGPTRHVYDVIVVGGQLGGALAAALLARRGLHVLLVEHEGAGRPYEHGGWQLPLAPFLLPPLKSMPAVEEALGELGLSTPFQRQVRQPEPPLQLLLPEARVDLHTDKGRRQRELARAFGEPGAAFGQRLERTAGQSEGSDGFFKEPRPLPPEGFFERWRLKRQAAAFSGLAATPALSPAESADALALGLAPFASFLHAPQAPLAHTRPLAQLLRGPLTLPGGQEGLRELLARRLAELGADVLGAGSPDAVVEHLVFDGRKVQGVKLLHSDTVLRAECVVAATDAQSLRRLLPDRKRQRRLAEQLDTASVRAFLLGVNWVLPEPALPRGLGELALLASSDAELGPLLLQVTVARRSGGALEEGVRTLSAGAFVPASAREAGEEHLAGLLARLEAQLEQVLPFSRRHLLLRSAPLLDASAVRAGRLLPHPLYAFSGEPALGVGGLQQRTPSPNLLLASQEVLPGLGLEGELLAGVRAARRVQELLKRPPALKTG